MFATQDPKLSAERDPKTMLAPSQYVLPTKVEDIQDVRAHEPIHLLFDAGLVASTAVGNNDAEDDDDLPGTSNRMEDHLTPPELLDGKKSRYELLTDSSDEEIVPPGNAAPRTGTYVRTVRGPICSFGKTPQLAAVDFPVLQDDEESQESIYDDMPALEYVCYSNSDTDEDYDVEYSHHPFNSGKDRNDALIPVNNRLTCKLYPRYFSILKYFTPFILAL